MSTNWKDQEFIDSRNALLNAMAVSRERYQKGKENADKRVQYETAIKAAEKKIESLREVGNHMRDIYSNIKSYSVNHQEQAKKMLDLMIEEAGNLVPDSDSEGVHLITTESNRVSVVNQRGQNVNSREGGGYRACLGALLGYAALKAQPDALQFMLFDEYFFTLDDSTTASLKEILSAMKGDMTIVGIEQRRNVMDGIADAEYTFKKGADRNTIVTKTL